MVDPGVWGKFCAVGVTVDGMSVDVSAMGGEATGLGVVVALAGMATTGAGVVATNDESEVEFAIEPPVLAPTAVTVAVLR
jgi:hypothetical protein